MDLLKLIRDQISSLPEGMRASTKIPFVLTHIARAEHFLGEAARLADDQYLNDSVYRANQAFEAILKEAYQFFTGKTASKLNIFQIENYILRHKILNQRVTDLLKNYRTQWRNPSTHDYSLSFSNQEALVAVVSVQMFIKVLLNQIVAEIAFRNERKRADEPSRTSAIVESYESMTFLEKIASICAAFAQEMAKEDMRTRKSHIEIQGALEAYITNVDSAFQVKSNLRSSELPVRIKSGPDFFIACKKEMMILELKIGYKPEYEEDALYRIIQYLSVFNPKIGLVFFYQPGVTAYEALKQEKTLGDNKLTISIVRPRSDTKEKKKTNA